MLLCSLAMLPDVSYVSHALPDPRPTISLTSCVDGPLVVKLAFKAEYVAETTKLLPWYAGAMIPLALANVLVNDLLARARFKVVLPMVLLAAAYGFTLPAMLHKFPGHMEIALQTLGVFNLLLLGASAWFTWGAKTAAKGEASG